MDRKCRSLIVPGRRGIDLHPGRLGLRDRVVCGVAGGTGSLGFRSVDGGLAEVTQELLNGRRVGHQGDDPHRLSPGGQRSGKISSRLRAASPRGSGQGEGAVEASIEQKIRRGRVLREHLKQDRLVPLPISVQMAALDEIIGDRILVRRFLFFRDLPYRLFDQIGPCDESGQRYSKPAEQAYQTSSHPRVNYCMLFEEKKPCGYKGCDHSQTQRRIDMRVAFFMQNPAKR